MVQVPDIIRQKVLKFSDMARGLYPVEKVLLYGSYAKGNAATDSDIDVAVVVNMTDHLKRIEVTARLFHFAGEVDAAIEPKCIFRDEYHNCPKASILS
ncbi:MAG: hypothetical protein GWP14_10130, partial [Actinobacteria bacterium]|nr:hypothetical protein [Actinomycetota bacterium]